MKDNITIITATIALATIVATIITTQMVVAQPDLNRNCKHGNPYACGQLNGDPGTVNGPNSELTLPGLGSSGINVDRK